MMRHSSSQRRKMVLEVLGDLPKPYSIGTSAILIERLPELHKKEVYQAYGILIHQPHYDRLVVRSELAFGLDNWTQIIDKDRKQYHQNRIDKAKLKAKRERVEAKQQQPKVIAPPVVEKPVITPPVKSRPVITIKRKRKITKPIAICMFGM